MINIFKVSNFNVTLQYFLTREGAEDFMKGKSGLFITRVFVWDSLREMDNNLYYITR